MSQVLTPRPDTTAEEEPRRGPTPGRGRRSMILLVVLLSLLVGTTVGWAAYTAATGDGRDTRATDAWQARLEGEAERFAQLAETPEVDAEQLRWEAQADLYAPGWRDG